MPFDSTCCEKPSALPWVSIPGTTLSATYIFQVLDKRYWCIYDYNRLKVNNDNTYEFELEKPFYVFTPNKSDNVYTFFFAGKVPIISYNNTTKTYALSYNAYTRKIFPPIPNLGNTGTDLYVNINRYDSLLNLNLFEPISIESVRYANNTTNKIPIKSFSKELTSFTFNSAASALLDSINTGENIHLSGAIYALNTPPKIYNFLIELSTRNLGTGDIFAKSVIEGEDTLNSTWLSSISSEIGDMNDNVGYVYLNTMTAYEDLLGSSYVTPLSVQNKNFTTTQIITAITNGIKAPLNWNEPFKVVSSVPEYPEPGYNVTWDITNGGGDLTTTAKRNKLYVSAYDCTTLTYYLSDKGGPGELFTIDNNFDSTYLYQWLYTRIYRNNKWFEVRISNINTDTGEITVETDVHCESFVVPESAGLRTYLCDEMLTVPDTAAGTLKIFPRSNNNTAEVLSSSIGFVYELLSSSSYAPDIYSGLGRSRPFKDGIIERDKGGDNNELSGYSIPFITYFKRSDYKARYWYPTPPGDPLPNQQNPEGRWQYSQKALFFDFNVRTAPITSIPTVVFTDKINNAEEPFYVWARENSVNPTNLLFTTFAYKLTSTTNTPYRFTKNLYFANYNPVELYLTEDFLPLSAGPPYSGGNPARPTIVQTSFDTLCTLTSGYSLFGEKVMSTDTHHFIVDPYTKETHIYYDIFSNNSTPYYILSAPSFLDNMPITITKYGTHVTGRSYSDSGSYFAIAFNYYYNSTPTINRNCVVIYNVPKAQSYIIPQIMTYIKTDDMPSTSAEYLDNTIGGMVINNITNRTNNKTTQFLLMLSRPFNTYYSPTTGFIEFYNLLSNPPSLFYTLSNNRPDYYMGTAIDLHSNYAVTTLSAKSTNTQNLVNLYNLSAYTVNRPAASPTPSITPSPTPTLAPIDINITFGPIPDTCIAAWWDGSPLCPPPGPGDPSCPPGFTQTWQIDGTYTSQIDEYGTITGEAGRRYYKKIKDLDGVYTPGEINGPAIMFSPGSNFPTEPWQSGAHYYLEVPNGAGPAAGIDLYTKAETIGTGSSKRLKAKESEGRDQGYTGWPKYGAIPPTGNWFYKFKSVLCNYHWGNRDYGPYAGIYLSAGETGFANIKIQMGKGNDVPFIPTPTPTYTPSPTPVVSNFCVSDAGFVELIGDYNTPTEAGTSWWFYSGPTIAPGLSSIAVEYRDINTPPWRIYIEDFAGAREVDIYTNSNVSHIVPTNGWVSEDPSYDPAATVYIGPCVTPSVTPTLTITPSLTPTLTITPSLTPSLTPTITLTPTPP